MFDDQRVGPEVREVLLSPQPGDRALHRAARGAEADGALGAETAGAGCALRPPLKGTGPPKTARRENRTDVSPLRFAVSPFRDGVMCEL